MKFTKKSLELINIALNTSDIYSINNLSYKIIAHDIGTAFDNRVDEIRTKWLFSKTGLYNGIVDNKYAIGRILEQFYVGDFNKTFRQRLNIVQEMLKVDFKSNVPVHLSISPKIWTNKGKKNYILDFKDPSSFDDFSIIIHPGQTRAQASVFAKRNLDNVLLYIPKVYKEYITIKNFPEHKKITGEKELLPCYSTFESKDDDRVVDLKFMGIGEDIDRYLKFHKHPVPGYIHRYEKIYILKACSILVNGKEEHPSHYYLEQSFISYNKFSQILHRNSFTLYTTLHRSDAMNLFFDNTSKLFSLSIKGNKKSTKKLYNILESTDSPNPAHTVYFTDDMIKSFDDKSIRAFIKGIQNTYDTNRSPLSYEERHGISDTPCTIHYPIVSVEHGFEYTDVAKQQNYKGFAVWYNPENINKPKIFRDIYELLYFTGASVACTRSENNELAIINCEHEFWRTRKNYKEWILTKEMYND